MAETRIGNYLYLDIKCPTRAHKIFRQILGKFQNLDLI